MNKNQARRKALNQKRDQMLDLFTDSRIKMVNKPVTYGEFYDYVIDLDNPAPQAKQASAPAIKQGKPTIAKQSEKSTSQPLQQQSNTAQTQAEKPASQQAQKTQTSKDNGSGSIWENYTK